MTSVDGASNVPVNQTPLPIVVLISGRGSNLGAIIRTIAEDGLPVAIRAVISNRPGAAGLRLAQSAGIPTHTLDHRLLPDRQAFDQQLLGLIEPYQPALVVLAGFMRILTPEFVRHYHGRMINSHPSLLPDLPGLNTHARALKEGRKEHGASVHFVTEELDGGPVIGQARVPVLPGDTPETLAQRVLAQEHRLYPDVLRWFAEHRVRLTDGKVTINGAAASCGGPGP